MQLAQLDSIKLRLSIDPDDVQYDAILSRMLDRTSQDAERMMNRTVLSAARTTTHDWLPGRMSISLAAYPVTTITDVRVDESRVFGTDTIIDSTTYYVETASGLLYFDVDQPCGRGIVRVSATGGMAATTSAFVAAYPDIADAVAERVCLLWQRRSEIGLTSVSGSQGSISRISDDWPSQSRATILAYRRVPTS